MRWIARLALAALALMAAQALAQAPHQAGYLGIRVRAAEQGARILSVGAGSAAEAAGLLEGDVILSADGVSFAGQAIEAMTARLKGPRGTPVLVSVSRFPGDAPPVPITVTRGPPGLSPPDVQLLIPADQRLSNQWMGQLRRGETPDLRPALQQSDHRAVTLALARLSGPWWMKNDGDAAARQRFWQGVGSSAEIEAALSAWPAEDRLPVAHWLSPHSGSAPLALKLLSGDSALSTLARAAHAGELAPLCDLPDIGGDLSAPGGWSAAVGPSLVELAIAERLADATADGQTEPIPPACVSRLQAAGLFPPGVARVEPTAFATVPPAPSPALRLPTPEGGSLDLAAHPGPVVLSFWATWCGPCRQELPRLEALRDELRPQGLEVWAISVDDTADAIRAYTAKNGLNLPTAMADAATRRAFNIGPIPRTVVLNADKAIIRDHSGFSPESFEHQAEEIRALARGELETQRTLGRVEWGDVPWKLTANLNETAPILALAPDKGGQLWVASEDSLTPMHVAGEAFVASDQAPIPLAFPADLVAWGDVNGDASPELLTAARGGQIVRLSSGSGSHLWTHRSVDEVKGVAFWGDATGRQHVVVLRSGFTRPDGSPPQRRDYMDVVDAGVVTRTIPLPSEATGLVGGGPHNEVIVLTRAEIPLVMGPDGALRPTADPHSAVRGAAWGDVNGDGISEAIVTAGYVAHLLSVNTAGERHFIAQTTGGALVGLSPTGEITFKLRLKKRSLAAVARAEGGAEALIVSVPGFGLAALALNAK